MGDIRGHIIPGTFFCMFAFYWCIRLFMRYFDSLTKNGIPFISSVTFPPRQGRCSKVNVEAIVIMSMGVIGIFIEIVASSILRDLPIKVTNIQHATMYFFFGMAGAVALIVPYMKCFSNSEDIVYVSLVLAYIGEALLFKFHLFGRDSMDVTVHVLLLYTAYACVVAALVEMRFRKNVLTGLTRAFFTFLQGSWFWQVGFILYNPFGESWGSDDHNDDVTAEPVDEHLLHNRMMLVTCMFAWHMAVIFAMFLIVGACVGLYYKRRYGFDQTRMFQKRSPADCGYSVVGNDEDP